jgi:hypothetical protein
VNKKVIKGYAELIYKISHLVGDERSAKCGYDLFMGLADGTHKKRAKAWNRYIDECLNDSDHVDTERDGVWVPAIPTLF